MSLFNKKGEKCVEYIRKGRMLFLYTFKLIRRRKEISDAETLKKWRGLLKRKLNYGLPFVSQVSISSTFYTQIFCTNVFFLQLFSSYMQVEKAAEKTFVHKIST